MILNIAWLSSRKNGCFEWFVDSLHRECNGEYGGLRVIAVDFWSQPMEKDGWTTADAEARIQKMRSLLKCPDSVLTPPKPNVWNGRYRLTRSNYFAAANARNTAICHARDGYLVFCDDLSILMPGWLAAVREHQGAGSIVCGAFRKVNKMVVENGQLKSFEDHPGGWDSRWNSGKQDEPVKCPPNWLFGCSFGAPVERFIEINGLYEACDSTGIGLEDCSTGIAFGNNGHQLYYDRRVCTYEAEELHHAEPPMLRMDKHKDTDWEKMNPGVPDPSDKGHALVNMFTHTKRFENYFGEEGIGGLRQKILRGNAFPITQVPEHDWYDGQELKTL